MRSLGAAGPTGPHPPRPPRRSQGLFSCGCLLSLFSKVAARLGLATAGSDFLPSAPRKALPRGASAALGAHSPAPPSSLCWPLSSRSSACSEPRVAPAPGAVLSAASPVAVGGQCLVGCAQLGLPQAPLCLFTGRLSGRVRSQGCCFRPVPPGPLCPLSLGPAPAPLWPSTGDSGEATHALETWALGSGVGAARGCVPGSGLWVRPAVLRPPASPGGLSEVQPGCLCSLGPGGRLAGSPSCQDHRWGPLPLVSQHLNPKAPRVTMRLVGYW